jgi:chaperone modulatory protein CbpM
MIDIDIVITRVSGVERSDLEQWIQAHLVTAEITDGQFMFHEVDVARIRLIRELRDDMEVNEAALPVVMSLLDQLYDMRRRMRQLGLVLEEATTADVRRDVIHRLIALEG